MRSGTQQVVLHRTAPFTATEHARAVAFAEVAAELVGPGTVGAADWSEAPTPDAGGTPEVRLATFDDTSRDADAPALLRGLGLPPVRRAAGPHRRP